MGWTVSSFAILVFASAVVAFFVGIAALRERPDPMAWPLTILMLAVTVWAIPHAISFGYTSPDRVVFWTKVQYPGIGLAPVAYLVVALRYAGYERWLSRRTYALLALVPALTLVVVWTNPQHGLFWQSYSVGRVDGASILVPTYGPWYWLNLGYLYLVTGVALLAFGSVVLTRGPVYRKQAVVMFVGGLVPLAVNVAITAGIGPDPMIDLTTTALTVTGLTFALALFRFNLLDIRPVARDRLLNKLDDGVVVIGPEGQIRDYNPTAERVLGELAVSQPAEEVLPATVVPDGGELVVETDDGERYFRTRSNRLTDPKGEEIGRIIYLNDITELIKREQRISVLNRILRHNIRNELNVASGHLELLEKHAREDNQEHVQTAMQSTQRVIDFAEKARHVQRTLKESETTMVISPVATVKDVMMDAEGRFDGATFRYERSGDPDNDTSVQVVSRELFRMAIMELVENAVVHSDREDPQVTIRIETGNDQVRVNVIDNGPGIPEEETKVLSSSVESHLEHSSGLGLWLVKWTASLSSGTLSFTDNDPRGTVATVTLPAAD